MRFFTNNHVDITQIQETDESRPPGRNDVHCVQFDREEIPKVLTIIILQRTVGKFSQASPLHSTAEYEDIYIIKTKNFSFVFEDIQIAQKYFIYMSSEHTEDIRIIYPELFL